MSYYEDRFLDYLGEGDGQLGASPGDTLYRLRRDSMTIENVKCPECDGEMVSRKSQYGVFWGCKAFPKCKGTRDNQGRSKAEREAERDKNREEDERYPNEVGFPFSKRDLE